MSDAERECRLAWLDAYVTFLFADFYRRFPTLRIVHPDNILRLLTT